MKRLLKSMDKIEIYVLMVTFPLMLLFIFMATIFRYFELGSLPWAEEASRYLMIWLAFAGISLGFKTNAHMGLSFVVDRFPKKSQKIFHFIRSVLIILFGVLVAYNSFLLIRTQIINPQRSPGIGIPIWVIYCAILLGFIMVIIRTLQMAFAERKNAKGGKEV